MPVVFCGICPHPPIALPEVGYEESEKVASTQKSIMKLGQMIKESRAEIIVIISPHAPVFRDVVAINRSPELHGDLMLFRAGEVYFNAITDQVMAEAIGREANSLGLETVDLEEEDERKYNITLRLDHGVTVPMYFIRKSGVMLPLVHVAMSVAPLEKLYLFGVAVRQAANATDKKVAILASGDLSHGLTIDAPGGYLPNGEEFDRQLVSLLEAGDFDGVLSMDQKLVESAGECGYRTVVMMLGALDGTLVNSEILTYEGPFGVGYLTAAFTPLEDNRVPSIRARLEQEEQARMATKRASESFLVKLARDTLERHVKGEKAAPVTEIPTEFQGKRAGVFVSIKKHGILRGCIGTVAPTEPDIISEVANNAISAGMEDPRFQQVTVSELTELEYSVDVINPPEPIDSFDELDPKKYGVVVRSGAKSGLLLPDLEGIDTVEEQVAIASQKAGIGPHEHVKLERFDVSRYT